MVAASAPSVVNASNVGSALVRPGDWKWSLTQSCVDAGDLEQVGDRADLVPGAAVLRHADPDARCRPAHGLPTTTTSWAVGAAAWSAAEAGMGAMS